jgi:hypothetical protein
MRTYEFPPAADVEQAYRAAHRALEGITAQGSFVPEKDLTDLAEVITQFQPLVWQATSLWPRSSAQSALEFSPAADKRRFREY